MEPKYGSKLAASAGSLVQVKSDIMALQEVNQSRSAPPVTSGRLWESDYVPCCTKDLNAVSLYASRAVVHADNHALNLMLLLARVGVSYQQTWTPAKVGYGIYDEGLTVLSRSPILGTSQFYITGIRDYENWETRKMFGIDTWTKYENEYFCSVHVGWWSDSEEPFREQWSRISNGLSPLAEGRLWLMGDPNSPAHITGQGQDLILASDWFDAYDLVASRDLGVTVVNVIDG